MAYTSVKISADSSSYQSQMESAALQMKSSFAEHTTGSDESKSCSGQKQQQPQGKSRIAHSKNHGAKEHRAVEQ